MSEQPHFVLRFSNQQAMDDLDSVLQAILRVVEGAP
jgi:very-short-patch-repair endonuclease